MKLENPAGNPIHAAEASLDAWWMPFTANRHFKAAPRMLARADGMFYWTPDGRQVLDGSAGLWCVNAGHNRQPIVEAVQKQAATMDYAPPFNMGHPIAFEAAGVIAAMAPAGMQRVFFTNSGSESADTAIKMALAYHRAKGEPSRRIIIGRERGYHGVNIGGMMAGGIPGNRKVWPAMMAGVDHIRATHDLARNAFSKGQPVHGAEFADELERLVAFHDASNVAAVIVEPMAGSAGVLIPPWLPGEAGNDLPQARHRADLRRGDHRLRAPGQPVRRAPLRCQARHPDLRQGDQQRRGANGRGDRR